MIVTVKGYIIHKDTLVTDDGCVLRLTEGQFSKVCIEGYFKLDVENKRCVLVEGILCQPSNPAE